MFVDDEKYEYVYVISKEDLILDRLRAAVHWKSEEDTKWGFKLLLNNYDHIDKKYLFSNTETEEEKKELEHWIGIIEKSI